MVRLAHQTKTYAKSAVKAVDDLSLEIRDGEIFGFLGPNGAGNTTTIKVLTGVLKPDSGLVEIDGIDMASAPRDAKALPYLKALPMGSGSIRPIHGSPGTIPSPRSSRTPTRASPCSESWASSPPSERPSPFCPSGSSLYSPSTSGSSRLRRHPCLAPIRNSPSASCDPWKPDGGPQCEWLWQGRSPC
jgi:energy-coupling factor transporter ATP-binding protein EcfA2